MNRAISSVKRRVYSSPPTHSDSGRKEGEQFAEHRMRTGILLLRREFSRNSKLRFGWP